jgi:DNA-binding NarL/FixJ family response regulator
VAWRRGCLAGKRISEPIRAIESPPSPDDSKQPTYFETGGMKMLSTNELNRSPRVVVADDNVRLLEKVVELLQPVCEVVGTVSNGFKALDAVEAFGPDIAILDISMPGLNGIEVARQLTGLASSTKIMILTVHEDADFMDAAFAAGASAYVVKSRIATDLTIAVAAVWRGEVFRSPFSISARAAARRHH